MDWDRLNEDILDRVDAVELIGRYVALKRAGKSYKGLCPFHSEKTPSFNVTPDNKLWHCFGCGAGGNIFNFLMRIEGLTFAEARKELADQVGVRIEDIKPEDPRKKRWLALHELAADYYRRALLETDHGCRIVTEYLDPRGITPAGNMAFGLGYAPDVSDSFVRLAVKKGFAEMETEESGLALSRDGVTVDRFRNRLMFPIRDLLGKPVAFAGRALVTGDEPKYLNSPQTAIFDKGRTLYALDLSKTGIQRLGYAVLVEGYMDVIGLFQAGFDNAVASMGTSLTGEQVKLLKRFTPNVFIAYDSDEAGGRAATRGIDLFLQDGLMPKLVLLPPGQDADDLVKDSGPEAWQKLVNDATPYFMFALRQLKSSTNWQAPEGKSAILKGIFPQMAVFKDPIILGGYLQKIAEEIGLDSNRMDYEWLRFKKSQSPERAGQKEMPSTLTEEMRFIGAFVKDPALGDALAPAIAPEDLQDPRLQKIYQALRSAGFGPLDDAIAALSEDEEASRLLSHLLHAKEISALSPDEARECAAGLKRAALRRRRAHLQQALEAASRDHDTQSELALTRELMDINKKLTGHPPPPV
ncbi:MAG: DNA primase [bacterium]